MNTPLIEALANLFAARGVDVDSRIRLVIHDIADAMTLPAVPADVPVPQTGPAEGFVTRALDRAAKYQGDGSVVTDGPNPVVEARGLPLVLEV